MAWCFEDETGPYENAVQQMIPGAEVVVPSIWPLEVANVLLVGERRQRLTKAASARFISLLGALPIVIEDTGWRGLGEVFSLARDQALSSYDAAYLELAMRLSLPLATRDERLSQAARRLGVAILLS